MGTTTPVSILVIAKYARRYPLCRLLQEQGYTVLEADTEYEGLSELALHPIDVTIYIMPEHEVDFIQQLRRATQMPIMIISPQLDETMIAETLDAGADDYVILPYSTVELLARVRVALRHRQLMPADKLLRVGDLAINSGNRGVRVYEKEVHLTLTEYRLLFMLAFNVEKVVTYEQLLLYAGRSSTDKNLRTLRMNVSNLRKKLEQKGLRSHYIITKVNTGYILENSIGGST